MLTRLSLFALALALASCTAPPGESSPPPADGTSTPPEPGTPQVTPEERVERITAEHQGLADATSLWARAEQTGAEADFDAVAAALSAAPDRHELTSADVDVLSGLLGTHDFSIAPGTTGGTVTVSLKGRRLWFKAVDKGTNAPAGTYGLVRGHVTSVSADVVVVEGALDGAIARVDCNGIQALLTFKRAGGTWRADLPACRGMAPSFSVARVKTGHSG